MVKQISLMFNENVDNLLKESEEAIKKSDQTTAHIKEKIKKNRERSRDVERRISLLL